MCGEQPGRGIWAADSEPMSLGRRPGGLNGPTSRASPAHSWATALLGDLGARCPEPLPAPLCALRIEARADPTRMRSLLRSLESAPSLLSCETPSTRKPRRSSTTTGPSTPSAGPTLQRPTAGPKDPMPRCGPKRNGRGSASADTRASMSCSSAAWPPTRSAQDACARSCPRSVRPVRSFGTYTSARIAPVGGVRGPPPHGTSSTLVQPASRAAKSS